MHLAAEPYCEDQQDQNGIKRKVWIFPLKFEPPAPFVTADTITEIYKKQEKALKNKDINQLKQLANAAGTSVVSVRNVKSRVYIRNAAVAEYTKKRADGNCELCGEAAPFSKNGVPYLECHHIKWVSLGGGDIIDNTVALCPNCHRRMHILNDSDDKVKLQNIPK